MIQARQRESGRKRAGARTCQAGGLLPLILLGPLAGYAAQGLGGIQKGFKAAEFFPPPHEMQMQSLLQAERVQPYSDKLFLLTGLTLQTFRETGEPELLVKTPQCLYDRDAKAASSPGSLRVTTADGKFSIEGEGFSLQQTNSSLIISNRVLTVIDPDLLNPSGSRVRDSTEKPGSPAIEIRADHFEYSRQTDIGLYERNVRVSGSNGLSLTSGKLAFHLPFQERQLKSMRAEQNVTVDQGSLHATGQTALYSGDTGLVRVTGEPAWRNEQQEGRGDLLILDRTNKIFRAEGNAWVKMPAHGLSISSLLTPSNAVPALAGKSTNQFVEVSSGYHEFRTNRAVFGEQVILTERADGQPRGTMTCGLLTVTYAGTNQLETLDAQTGVVMNDGTNRLTGGKAVFTGRDGILQFTESPGWVSGQRSGNGELIRINTRANEMLVRGEASMSLPASELAQAADLRSGSGSNKPDANATNQWAEVRSAEYTITPRQAQFRGRVQANHPHMNWTCGTLTVQLPPAGGQVQSIIAEQSVVFRLIDDKGQTMVGRGDRAVYTYAVTAAGTNDLVQLTGPPAVLETAQGTNRNKLIILDRAKQKVLAPGDYQIATSVKGLGTNALVLPNPKLTK